ncbi:unnamed protein product [Discosporangium mesarthrocarpum]
MDVTSTVELNNGTLMPRFGLGTWRSAEGEVRQAVEVALKEGYLHIDCAYCYFNQKEVGAAISAAIEEGVTTREKIFVTTKVWNTFHRPELLRKNMETCLKDLGLDYVDQVLLHYAIAMVPVPEGDKTLVPRHANGDAWWDEEVDLKDTWKAMEALIEDGLAKSIGVSNFTQEDLEYVMAGAKIIPAVNQVEVHPYLNNNELMAWCKERGVHTVAYAPLGNVNREFSSVLDDVVIKEIAARLSKTPAQVVIRWHLQRDVTVIPKSVTPSRIQENKDVFDFELSPEDMCAINALGSQNLRMCNWKWRPGLERLYVGETSAYDR